MPSVYLFAVQFGTEGLAWGWLVAFPVLLAVTIYQARPHIGFTLRGLAGSILPGLAASAAMAALVWSIDRMSIIQLWPNMPPLLHLALLVASGGCFYVGIMWLGARATFMEAVNLIVRRKPPAPDQNADIRP
jgi:hypothetical protein